MSDSTKKTKEFLTLKVGVKEPFKPTHETETVTKAYNHICFNKDKYL